MATINFEEREYEMGGSILHSSNLYMKSFLKLFDLKKKDDSKDSDNFVGFYDMNGIFLELNGKYFGLVDKLKMIKHFGLFQLLKFTRWVQSFISNFSK